MNVMQRLYDSEINCSVESFWDGGWTVKLGDHMNGFIAEETCRTMADVAVWLAEAACKHYPESGFAKRWGKQPAQGIVARSGETALAGSTEGKSPVGNADAP